MYKVSHAEKVAVFLLLILLAVVLYVIFSFSPPLAFFMAISSILIVLTL